MELQTFKRYEDKFLLDKKQYELLLKSLEGYMRPDKH